jgi:glycosyltransferase involved in cell wall biosynthesis
MNLSTFPICHVKNEGWPFLIGKPAIVFDPGIAWPRISIVTPSFNQGKYIEETIRSVLLQNYPNLEYIIIDGGSTDETIAIIKKYEPWISYWVSESDKGQSDAINKGIKHCTGEIFNWLNSDDWYEPEAFFEIASAFLRDNTLQIVSGYENHIGLEGQIETCEGTFLLETFEQTIELCQIAQPSTFFKLNTIRAIGGVSDDLHFIMDGEMWLKLLLRFGTKHFLKIEHVLVNFRLHENSKTVGNNLVNNFLYERCSIVADLQRFVGVPNSIIEYYVAQVYKSPKVYRLNRNWLFGPGVISEKKLKVYFIKKYVINQYINKKKRQAFWGLKLLIKNGVVDVFLFKNFLKLFVTK